MATITLRDLTVLARHGTLDHEKTEAQPFQVSLTLDYNAARSEQSDKLEHAIDYSVLRQTIIDTVQGTSFELLERLAREVADRLMQDERIDQLTIAIEKTAVFDSGVPGVSLTISRSK